MNKLPTKTVKASEPMQLTAEESTTPSDPATTIVAEITVELVSVEVPYAIETTSGYIDSEQCKRCDLGLLTRDQARKVRAIRRGYDYSGRRLANGNEVKSLADAVKMLLDSIDI